MKTKTTTGLKLFENFCPQQQLKQLQDVIKIQWHGERTSGQNSKEKNKKGNKTENN